MGAIPAATAPLTRNPFDLHVIAENQSVAPAPEWGLHRKAGGPVRLQFQCMEWAGWVILRSFDFVCVTPRIVEIPSFQFDRSATGEAHLW